MIQIVKLVLIKQLVKVVMQVFIWIVDLAKNVQRLVKHAMEQLIIIVYHALRIMH